MDFATTGLNVGQLLGALGRCDSDDLVYFYDADTSKRHKIGFLEQPSPCQEDRTFYFHRYSQGVNMYTTGQPLTVKQIIGALKFGYSELHAPVLFFDSSVEQSYPILFVEYTVSDCVGQMVYLHRRIPDLDKIASRAIIFNRNEIFANVKYVANEHIVILKRAEQLSAGDVVALPEGICIVKLVYQEPPLFGIDNLIRIDWTTDMSSVCRNHFLLSEVIQVVVKK